MQTQTLQITKWPFYTANAVLNFAAVLLVLLVPSFSIGTAFLFTFCAGLGALLLAAPFLLEYRARVQAHAIEVRFKTNMNEERFDQWAKDLKEQAQHLARLTERIENNMFATEGLVRRADRKLAALEKFESKMDQLLAEPQPASPSNLPAFRSSKNEPLFAASLPLVNENDKDPSIINEKYNLEGDIQDDNVGPNSADLLRDSLQDLRSSDAIKVIFQEDQSDYSPVNASNTFSNSNNSETYHLKNPYHDGKKESQSYSSNYPDNQNDMLTKTPNSNSFSIGASDAEDPFSEKDLKSAVVPDPASNEVSVKVRVSTKSPLKRKKSATDQSAEIPLFAEDNLAFPSSNTIIEESTPLEPVNSNRNDINEKVPAEMAQKAPESSYVIQSSESGQTLVVANVMIGLGNKPFIRGEGGELSWEKGKPMEFLEIGKWSYTFEKPAKHITFQIFKNDQDADEYIHKMQSGQMIEVSPKFVARQMSLV